VLVRLRMALRERQRVPASGLELKMIVGRNLDDYLERGFACLDGGLPCLQPCRASRCVLRSGCVSQQPS
jgi:hypothetical protein